MQPISSAFTLGFEHTLALNNLAQMRSLERLSTGYRINRGSDDPAGLIASENLRAALSSLDAESRSLERSQMVANTADAAMGQISDLLTDAEGLAVAAANTGAYSDAEREAMQLEMDSIMTSVDRIASTTTFNGERILDGYTTLTAGGESHTIDSAYVEDLGHVTVDGQERTLSDVKGGGTLNIVDGDAEGAASAIRQAINDVATSRGSLGSFSRNTVAAQMSTNSAAYINIAAAESMIRDTDYAFETANLARVASLAGASMFALGTSAQMRSNFLQIL